MPVACLREAEAASLRPRLRTHKVDSLTERFVMSPEPSECVGDGWNALLVGRHNAIVPLVQIQVNWRGFFAAVRRAFMPDDPLA